VVVDLPVLLLLVLVLTWWSMTVPEAETPLVLSTTALRSMIAPPTHEPIPISAQMDAAAMLSLSTERLFIFPRFS